MNAICLDYPNQAYLVVDLIGKVIWTLRVMFKLLCLKLRVSERHPEHVCTYDAYNHTSNFQGVLDCDDGLCNNSAHTHCTDGRTSQLPLTHYLSSCAVSD